MDIYAGQIVNENLFFSANISIIYRFTIFIYYLFSLRKNTNLNIICWNQFFFFFVENIIYGLKNSVV